MFLHVNSRISTIHVVADVKIKDLKLSVSVSKKAQMKDRIQKNIIGIQKAICTLHEEWYYREREWVDILPNAMD